MHTHSATWIWVDGLVRWLQPAQLRGGAGFGLGETVGQSSRSTAHYSPISIPKSVLISTTPSSSSASSCTALPKRLKREQKKQALNRNAVQLSDSQSLRHLRSHTVVAHTHPLTKTMRPQCSRLQASTVPHHQPQISELPSCRDRLTGRLGAPY